MREGVGGGEEMGGECKWEAQGEVACRRKLVLDIRACTHKRELVSVTFHDISLGPYKP